MTTKQILYYDCFAGIAGDMNLGALVDLGVEEQWLKLELKKLGLESFELSFSQEARRGIGGTRARVVVKENEQIGHRHFKDIRTLVETSNLSELVKGTSLKIFTKIAKAEAKVHGTEIEKVHFHEVGAIDSIIDIVGAALCLEYLGVKEIWSGPVQLGTGFVTCQHGTFPVPAPATAEILLGIPTALGGVQYEATTPTGAAILAATVDKFCERPRFRAKKVGYGVGQRDGEVPNLLRVFLGELRAEGLADDVEKEYGCLVECNIDDMNPELYEGVIDHLFKVGAQDVFITPIIMKKSRPAVTLSVICQEPVRAAVEKILLIDTSTFGVRVQPIEKSMLRREFVEVESELGKVCLKRAYYGGKLIKSKVEYSELQRLSAQLGVSVTEVARRIKGLEVL